MKAVNLKTKMLMVFMSLVVLSVAAMGFVSYMNSRQALEQDARNMLIAVRDIKKIQIKTYFTRTFLSIEIFSRSRDVEELHAHLLAHHDAGGVKADGAYDVKSPEYKRICDEYGKNIDRFLKDSGYYDIFMISAANGHVMYSVAREGDLGTNLAYGPFKESGLAELWALVVKKRGPAVVDFEPYAPSNNEPAFFAGTPIFKGDDVIGVMAVQLSLKHLNAIMAEREGMGKTGGSYLVGQDHLLRSDGYLDHVSIGVMESFVRQVKMENSVLTNALAGKTGESVETCVVKGKKREILTAYAPVEIGDMIWALFCDVDLDQVEAPVMRLRNWLMGIGVIILLVMGGLVYYFSSSVSGPVMRLTIGAEALAKGDLKQEVSTQRADEIGVLSRSLGNMVEAWRTIVQRIVDGAAKLSSSSEEISAATEEMSRGAESQMSQILKTSSGMEEMSGSIQEVSRNAKSTSDAAVAACDRAREGSAKVKATVGRIGLANESVKKLNLRVQDVGKVIQLIGEIAAQTNILALNAAIEAARAGEHGRGFDVVAEEIRKLAQRTAQSTEEISVSIEEIQSDTGASVRIMEEGTAMANEAGQVLEDIVEGIVSTTDMVQTISSAAAQQAKTAEEIADAVQGISGVSKETAQASREVAKSTQDLSMLAEQLQEITKGFKV